LLVFTVLIGGVPLAVGGSIIKFLVNGGDATEAFMEFHTRSRKAQLVLKSLPHRPAPKDVMAERGYNGHEELTKDYAELRRQLVAEGFFDPSMTEVAYRLTEVVLMHVAAYFLIQQGGFLMPLGLLLFGLVQGRCGWLMHEGGHYSMTGNIKLDTNLQIGLYGIGCGMSAGWWRSQHNRHHATPQKLQHDVDLETLPLMAFHSKVAARVQSPLLHAWLKMQAYLFIPVSCLLVALGWQFVLHPRYMFRTKKYSELASLAVRYVGIFAVVFAGYTWTQSIAMYLAYMSVGAAYIFTNFALSHTHLPVTNPNEFIHWVEYASNHTTNITSGPICDWWMAYLNFQIEHHLFPSMPQFRHPQISPRVRALFDKHGLQYDVRDYFPCLGDTLRNLNEVGNPPVKAA
jgi:fatty acid desaturase